MMTRSTTTGKKTKTPKQQQKEADLKELKKVIKFAKEQGIKRLKFKDMEIEFEEPNPALEELFEESLEEQRQKANKIDVQELLKPDAKDKPSVELDKDDLW